MELFPQLHRALDDQKYERPTPIQAQTIPPAIAGRDILGCAQTGTGKTAAFAIPILDYIGHEQPPLLSKQPTTLVLAPTRELALQIGESFRTYGRHVRYRQTLVYGGVSQHQQVSALRRGVDVLIATPGRLLDLMNQRHVDLSLVEIFVLDEVDRMLDMGFLPDLKRIIADLPRDRQSLFFSATMPPKIRSLAAELLSDPVSIDVTPPKSTSVEGITQTIRIVQRTEKFPALQNVLRSSGFERAIVFTRTKHGANALTKKLDRAGIPAAAIHGNKTQGARQRALDAFRSNRIQVLVATDVAARGIDIAGVTHVINYDMPVEPESYVHRVGRTGRAGAQGIAVSFCTAEERDELRAIEKLIGKKLNIENPEAAFPAEDSSRSTKKGTRPQYRGSKDSAHKSKRTWQARRPSKRSRSGSAGAMPRPAFAG
jgi:ATP-dependent RNA helicase RhlE